MQIDVLITANNADELFFTGKTTVVIDVLRSSSTIVQALKNGAREIVPVNTIEFAMKVSGGTLESGTLLAGERNSKKIDGFALGNSPSEFAEEIVKNKAIVLFTTNGTKSMVKAKYSENLLVGCFNNIEAVTEHLVKLNNDVVLFCSGTNGRLSLEDCTCAGMIVSKLAEKQNLEMDDAANVCLNIFKNHSSDINGMMRDSRHGQKLVELGYEDDLNFCAEIDNSDIVPVFANGNFKAKK